MVESRFSALNVPENHLGHLKITNKQTRTVVLVALFHRILI